LKEILICGSGEFAREIYHWIKQVQGILFKGFLDKNGDSLSRYNLSQFYISSEDNYDFCDNDYAIVAIANPHIRKKVFDSLYARGVNFYNFIHPSVIIGGNIKMGEGNIICPNSVLTTDIEIGTGNIFNINVTIGHDVKIGSFNTFNSHCDITGNVQIGDLNYSGSRVSFLPSCKIGNNNQISAGSVVYKGVKNNSILLGNPAKIVGDNL
jgi:sugar O-acyltransferase (sialic acid O-acetyltransferase NeuD family)